MSGASALPRALTVGALLGHPSLAEVRVLAGVRGLERGLLWVTRLDRLRDAAAVGAGDLLLARDATMLADGGPLFLSRLATRGAAGMAVSGAFAQGIPVESLAEADSAGLPLLGLPAGVGYRVISLAIAALVFAQGHEGGAPVDHGATAPENPGGTGILGSLGERIGKDLGQACLGPALRKLPDWLEVRDAVDSWLRHGCNAIAAAEELGVHRHTVRARLRRYESVSGLSLEDSDARLLVELAFRLSRENGGGRPAAEGEKA